MKRLAKQGRLAPRATRKPQQNGRYDGPSGYAGLRA